VLHITDGFDNKHADSSVANVEKRDAPLMQRQRDTQQQYADKHVLEEATRNPAVLKRASGERRFQRPRVRASYMAPDGRAHRRRGAERRVTNVFMVQLVRNPVVRITGDDECKVTDQSPYFARSVRQFMQMRHRGGTQHAASDD